MFYYEKIRTVRQYIAHRPDTLEHKIKKIYMFVENLNNVVSLNEDFYVYAGEESITGKNITIAYENNLFAYEFRVWEYASLAYNFKLSYINLPDHCEMNKYIHFEKVHGKIRQGTGPLYNVFPPTMHQWFDIFVKRPDPAVSSIYFMKVFSPQMWWAILFTLLAIVLFLLAFKFILKKFKIDLFEIILMALGVSSPSNHNNALLHTSFKISQLCISIFTLLILTAFGTFLQAAIATREIHLPFQNLDNLFNGRHNYIPCATPRTVLLHLSHSFNYTNNPTCFKSKENLNDWLCAKNHAYILSNTIINPKLLEKLKCEIVKLPQKCFIYYRTNLLTYAFRHINQLRVSVTKMRTTGVMGYTYKRYRNYGETEFMLRNRIIEPDTTVYFEHVVLILIAYGMAVAAAFTIFLIEMCGKRHKMKHFNRLDQLKRFRKRGNILQF